MTKDDISMILKLARLKDTEGLKGYLAGLRHRAVRLDKVVKLALVLSRDLMSELSERDGDLFGNSDADGITDVNKVWNHKGLGFKADVAVREALKEFDNGKGAR